MLFKFICSCCCCADSELLAAGAELLVLLLLVLLLLLLLQVMAEGKSEEHSLEYQELFNEYLLIFEGKLEEFIGKTTVGCGWSTTGEY